MLVYQRVNWNQTASWDSYPNPDHSSDAVRSLPAILLPPRPNTDATDLNLIVELESSPR